MLTGFALGVMNLAWMAALTVVISLEQGMRAGVGLGRVFGGVLIAWGLARLWLA
jgi:predicted metal-binding membrane protein